MRLVIREARDEDWDWIREGMLESAFLTEHPRRQATMDRKTLEQRVRDDIRKYGAEATKPQQAYVAELDGARVGLVWVTVTPWDNAVEPSTWLLDIYVIAEQRGKGIAKALMEKAEEWSRRQGAKELWLNAGWSNEKAIGLYRHLGFEVETVHMSKQL